MTRYLVYQGSSEVPRWNDAFSELEVVAPHSVIDHAVKGDLAWVVVEGGDWTGLCTRLASKGVLVSVLSFNPHSAEAYEAFTAGARGYVHALSTPEVLRQVDVVVRHRGIWLWPELMDSLVGGVFKAMGGAPAVHHDMLEGLTEREKDVALAVAEGQSNKLVARELGITERTVKAHLGAVFRKLGVKDRMQLILRLSRDR
ncbi:response regulator transcription factor [Halomonas sp. DP1Y21-3]|uniref:helix-turn-helix transcriptional regulator n=1 Tax=Halomonas sp. DP1Y21-3 TaxID=2859080 RepID=UPI001C9576C5|nr:response regulator transcription factor [Halomonas sp. DP1Y21-3]MBY6111729.1 response regulator transcription factor [Halomonas sp. DP1Y21-3]